jgi:hypothetical protein
MRALRSIIFFFLTLICFTAGAQDVIIRKNGNRINCKIQTVDSAAVHYSINGGPVIRISRTEVDRYFLSKSSAPAASKDSAAHPDAIPVIAEKNDLLLIDLNGGLAVPLSEFANKDVSNESSGLAQNGFMLEGMITLKFFKYAGISAGYRYQTHPLDHDRIDDYLASLYPQLNFSSQSTPWIMRGFFGGLQFYLPIKIVKGLSLNAGFMLGIPQFSLPGLTTTANSFGGTIIVTQYVKTSHAMTYSENFSVVYKVSENFALKGGASFIQSYVSFKDILTASNFGQVSYSDYSQEITALSVQAGLIILLNK